MFLMTVKGPYILLQSISWISTCTITIVILNNGLCRNDSDMITVCPQTSKDDNGTSDPIRIAHSIVCVNKEYLHNQSSSQLKTACTPEVQGIYSHLAYSKKKNLV